jgi:hypothetical protein
VRPQRGFARPHPWERVPKGQPEIPGHSLKTT